MCRKLGPYSGDDMSNGEVAGADDKNGFCAQAERAAAAKTRATFLIVLSEWFRPDNEGLEPIVPVRQTARRAAVAAPQQGKEKGRRRNAAPHFQISRVRLISPAAEEAAVAVEAAASGTECRRSRPYHPGTSPWWAAAAEAAAADMASLPESWSHRGIHGWLAWTRTPKAQP